MDRIKIRAATIDDVESISKLILQLGYTLSINNCKKYLSPILQLSSHRIFIAVDTANICGVIHLQKLYNIICESQCEILALVVDQTKRRMGIGKMLLMEAEIWAIKQKISTIKVSSNIVRKQAHQFYIKNDYTLVKTQHYFKKNIINHIHCVTGL